MDDIIKNNIICDLKQCESIQHVVKVLNDYDDLEMDLNICLYGEELATLITRVEGEEVKIEGFA